MVVMGVSNDMFGSGNMMMDQFQGLLINGQAKIAEGITG
jgi:hypothetical protein